MPYNGSITWRSECFIPPTFVVASCGVLCKGRLACYHHYKQHVYDLLPGAGSFAFEWLQLQFKMIQLVVVAAIVRRAPVLFHHEQVAEQRGPATSTPLLSNGHYTGCYATLLHDPSKPQEAIILPVIR